MKPVNSRTNRCTGRHEYHWLVARHSVIYATIFACIVCATLYCTGLYPQLDRTLKSWETGEKFVLAGYKGEGQTARLGSQS
ncbi:hypothetical protein [Microcoleus sp. N9_A1]|uniref:hypothetical protein n=1 Tax=Microcoleus sp. N9_A1 TaxID=3055380 RepID=UPI002FD1A150